MDRWSLGGIALMAGGIVGAVGGVLFLALDTLGAWLTVLALLGVGLGLLSLAVGFRRTPLPQWGVVALGTAGGLLLLQFLVSALADLGVRGMDVLGLALPVLAGLVLLAAAIAVLAFRAAQGAARWILLLPAVWSVGLSLLALTGPLDSWWAVAVGDLLFAAVGVVYFRAAHSTTSSFRPRAAI